MIKPSGVDYDALSPDDMVVMDLEGNKIEGRYKPSSDTATHIELYKKYEEIGGMVQPPHTGAGRKRYPSLWNHTCRLLFRSDPVCKKPDAGGDRGSLREKYRISHHRDI